jgi:hypothetical protein
MSMLMKLCLSLLFCFVGAAAANATSLTLDNCDGGCNGADVTLDVTNNNNGTFTVLYTFDTTEYNGPGDYLVQVGFKTIQGYTDADLVSVSHGSVSDWSLAVTAPVTSNGSPCTAGGDGTDKVCIYALDNLLSANADQIYVFEFLVTGGTEMDDDDWHFGGQWGDTSPARGQILSDEKGAPPIPEPSAALLFGIGVVTVGRSLRRRA